jgi:hypothetical protein
MTELRKQFEVLPEINKKIVSYKISFDEGSYNSPFSHINEWMNGAWWAFQQQQKKIDSLLDHVCGSFEDFK